MNIQTISIKTVRDNIADIVEEVSRTGKQYIITKFDKPKVLVSPLAQEHYLSQKEERERRIAILNKTFGSWQHRTDITDSVEFINQMRQKRHEKISA